MMWKYNLVYLSVKYSSNFRDAGPNAYCCFESQNHESLMVRGTNHLVHLRVQATRRWLASTLIHNLPLVERGTVSSLLPPRLGFTYAQMVFPAI
jgi:hypothetical protein